MAMRRFCYHDSLPFNYANSPFFQPLVNAIACVGPGYKAPSHNSLRQKDLNDEFEYVKAQLDNKLVEEHWVHNYVRWVDRLEG